MEKWFNFKCNLTIATSVDALLLGKWLIGCLCQWWIDVDSLTGCFDAVINFTVSNSVEMCACVCL